MPRLTRHSSSSPRHATSRAANANTPYVDLDTIYSHNGVDATFEEDDLKFAIGESKSGLLIDFPRDEDGRALIADQRNDNNVILAQMTVVRILIC